MHRRLISWLLFILVWTAHCVPAHAETGHTGWMHDYSEALALSRRLNKPLLIHFYADWCGPCKQMERSVLNRREVLAELSRSVIAVKINTDRNPKVAEQYGVTALPSDVFVEPSGARLLESEGKRSVAEYRMAIARASTRYRDLVAQRTPRPTRPDRTPSGKGEPQTPGDLAGASELKPLLDGYCPVTLWSNRRWEKGSPQFRAEFRGQIYLTTSEANLKEFNANPERYAPRFLGCDPVVVYESDRAVLGSTRYAAFYDNELYMFVDDINRQAFKRNPDHYVRTRVVLHLDQIETVTR